VADESWADLRCGPIGCTHDSCCSGDSVCSPIERYNLLEDGCVVDRSDEDGVLVGFQRSSKSLPGISSSSVSTSRRHVSSCSSPGVLYTSGIGEDGLELCGEGVGVAKRTFFSLPLPLNGRLRIDEVRGEGFGGTGGALSEGTLRRCRENQAFVFFARLAVSVVFVGWFCTRIKQWKGVGT
jgi:hypothetical protein